MFFTEGPLYYLQKDFYSVKHVFANFYSFRYKKMFPLPSTPKKEEGTQVELSLSFPVKNLKNKFTNNSLITIVIS